MRLVFDTLRFWIAVVLPRVLGVLVPFFVVFGITTWLFLFAIERLGISQTSGWRQWLMIVGVLVVWMIVTLGLELLHAWFLVVFPLDEPPTHPKIPDGLARWVYRITLLCVGVAGIALFVVLFSRF